ncbi:CsiV family protein [Azotobacter vinelandii]|uniref:CsiV family protein n=1 Tax=Azotobacter vinelandii TaxID=354 RepID=UPI00077475BD|nr:CsiV family protein [Azotobacter vinelandii]WKN23438.1 peptidoglycan binding protein CsiV [Azotobacter vinelandii]
MRALRLLPLLLALLAPAAFAEGLYQVELILFRQPGDPLPAGQPPAENWAAGAQTLNDTNRRTPALEEQAAKLAGAEGYKVLLHQAWQQQLGGTASRMALSAGKESHGHHPIEGTLSLTQGRYLDVAAEFWINRFDNVGFLAGSERLKQTSRLSTGQFTFLDHGNLGLLIRVTPL